MWICPKCCKSDYTPSHQTVTCMSWAQRVVDGVVVSRDPNYTTECRKCNKCGTTVSVKSQYGAIVSQTVLDS